MTSKDGPRKHPFHAGNAVSGILVGLGVSAPIWSPGGTGYSGLDAIAQHLRDKNYQHIPQDLAYAVRTNIVPAAGEGIALVGTGWAIHKGLGWARRRGMFRGMPI